MLPENFDNLVSSILEESKCTGPTKKTSSKKKIVQSKTQMFIGQTRNCQIPSM